MGYQVIYEIGKGEKGKKEKHTLLLPMTVAAWMAFLMLVNARWPEGQAVLRQVLFPEQAGVAMEVFNAFAQELKEGEAFPEALEAFVYQVTEYVRPD